MASENPIYGPFFGVMGAASAIIFSGMYFMWSIIVEMAVLTDYRSPEMGYKQPESSDKMRGMHVVNNLYDVTLIIQFESGYFRSTNYSSSRTLCFTLALHKYIDMHDGMSQFDNDSGKAVFCGKGRLFGALYS